MQQGLNDALQNLDILGKNQKLLTRAYNNGGGKHGIVPILEGVKENDVSKDMWQKLTEFFDVCAKGKEFIGKYDFLSIPPLSEEETRELDTLLEKFNQDLNKASGQDNRDVISLSTNNYFPSIRATTKLAAPHGNLQKRNLQDGTNLIQNKGIVAP